MQETWPDLPPRNRDAVWTLVSDTWDEVASSRRYVRSLIESPCRDKRDPSLRIRDSGHLIKDARS
jgi:hypothetical protein